MDVFRHATAVHVVDDDECVRTSLCRLLRSSGYEAVAHASAAEFVIAWHRERVACLILDVYPPGLGGLELQRELGSDGPPTILISGAGTVPEVVQAMRRGALGFLTKPIDGNALLEAVAEGVARTAAREDAERHSRRMREAYESLTERERAVLARVADGRLNKQIAADLALSERTVKTHRANGMQKLGVAGTAELVHLAERLRELGHDFTLGDVLHR